MLRKNDKFHLWLAVRWQIIYWWFTHPYTWVKDVGPIFMHCYEIHPRPRESDYNRKLNFTFRLDEKDPAHNMWPTYPWMAARLSSTLLRSMAAVTGPELKLSSYDFLIYVIHTWSCLRSGCSDISLCLTHGLQSTLLLPHPLIDLPFPSSFPLPLPSCLYSLLLSPPPSPAIAPPPSPLPQLLLPSPFT